MFANQPRNDTMKLLILILLPCMLAGSLPAAEYSQTHDNIAVHLVSLETGRLLQPVKDRSMIEADGEYVAVTYLVEHRGNGKIDYAGMGGLSCWSKGMEVIISTPNSAGEQTSSGVVSRYNLNDVRALYQHIDLSMVENVNRTFLHRELWLGRLPDDMRLIDIKLSAGFNDEIHNFVFKDIPVGSVQAEHAADNVE
jgi:hypothetical protein